LLEHQNNFIETLKIMSNTAKNLDILATTQQKNLVFVFFVLNF